MESIEDILSSGRSSAPEVPQETQAKEVEQTPVEAQSDAPTVQENPEEELTAEEQASGRVPVEVVKKLREEKREALRGSAAQLAARDEAHAKELQAREAATARLVQEATEKALAKYVQSQSQNRAPQQEESDFWADPERKIEERERRLREEIYENMAIQQLNDDDRKIFQEVRAELEQKLNSGDQEAIRDYKTLMAYPAHERPRAVVSAVKRNRLLQRLGDDPDAYINAEVEKRLAERGQAQQEQELTQQRPAPVMPSNLASVRNVGVRNGPAWGGPSPLQDIFARKRSG
jgi:hypothetical protein